MKRFRQIFYDLVPWWLSVDDGEKVLHALTRLQDAFYQRARLALLARFPTYAPESALAYIGRDRGILRGRDEAKEHYAARLKRWRWPRGHRVRGNTFALLEQIAEYFGGIHAWVIDANGTKRVRNVDGSTSYSYDNAWNWDGAGALPRWGRAWLVLEPNPELGITRHPVADDPYWATKTIDQLEAEGVTVDHVGISYEDARAVIGLLYPPHAWKPSGVRAEFAVIVFDDHTSSTPPVPDGNWGSYQGRDPAFGYWDLSKANA